MPTLCKALMQDQVEGMRAKGLSADYLSSTRTEAERRETLRRLDAAVASATTANAATGQGSAGAGGRMQQEEGTEQAPLVLLYVTPELLQTEAFAARLRAAHAAGAPGRRPIKLVAIDEAHCISQYVRARLGV